MSDAMGWVGFPPKVGIQERMLISSVPENEREVLMKYLQFYGPLTKTRSGEVVFLKRQYEDFKRIEHRVHEIIGQ